MPLRVFALRLFYFLRFGAMGIYLPFLPRWIEARGVLGLGLGVVFATLPAMSLVAPPAFGFIADVFGLRGYLLRVACAGAALAMLALALTPTLTGHDPAFSSLFLAVIVFAFFRAPLIPLADVIALEEVRSGSSTYPRLRVWGSIGFLVTAVTAGRFLDVTRPAALPIAVAACLVAALAASFALPARARALPVPAPGHVRALLRSRDFPLFLGAAFVAQVAHSCYDTCYSLHLRDLGVSGASTGIAWGIGVVAEVATMALGAPLFKRFSAPHLLAVAYAITAVRWVLIATVRSPAALFALQLLHAASFALVWLSSLAHIASRVPPQILATAQGLFTASIAAGGVAGTLAWGPLYHRAGGAMAFLVAALVSTLASLLALALTRLRGSRALPPSVPEP